MANLLSLLGMASVAGADTNTAALEGQQIKRDRDQKDLLAQLQQQRQAEQDAQAREMQALQRKNLLSMIDARNAPPPVPERRPDRRLDNGQIIDMDTGVATAVQGYQAPAPKVEAPRAPVRGTPEYLDVIRDEAKARAEAEANTPTGTERARVEQQARAFRNVKSSLNNFEQLIKTRGVTLMPGEAKAAQETEYEGLQLQLKELFNLGVLNGPDLELMRRIINNPSALTTQLSRLGNSDPQATILAQIKRVRGMIDNYERNLAPVAAPPAGNTVTTSSGRTFQRVNP